jgi:hypothetical protein
MVKTEKKNCKTNRILILFCYIFGVDWSLRLVNFFIFCKIKKIEMKCVNVLNTTK